MVIEKTKNLKPPNPTHKPGSSINKLRSELEKLPQYEDNDNGGSIDLPDIPDDIIDQIVSDSTEKIHTRLEERAYIIEGLAISDQELREFSGLLNPIGDADTRIEMLDQKGNEYGLKSLRETDNRKEQLYKNISETAKLKADYIKVTEKGEKPENQEATEIIKGTANNNESIKDLTRLERFKEWAKENLVGVSALAISIAGIITTIIVGAGKAISQGAKATGKFAKAVYNLGKKLGPLLAPLLNIITQAISWGAKGLPWLANNLYILVIAAWFIYDQYKQRRKK